MKYGSKDFDVMVPKPKHRLETKSVQVFRVVQWCFPV